MRISVHYTNIIEFDQLMVNGREGAGGYGFTLTLRGSRQKCDAQLRVLK